MNPQVSNKNFMFSMFFGNKKNIHSIAAGQDGKNMSGVPFSKVLTSIFSLSKSNGTKFSRQSNMHITGFLDDTNSPVITKENSRAEILIDIGTISKNKPDNKNKKIMQNVFPVFGEALVVFHPVPEKNADSIGNSAAGSNNTQIPVKFSSIGRKQSPNKAVEKYPQEKSIPSAKAHKSESFNKGAQGKKNTVQGRGLQVKTDQPNGNYVDSAKNIKTKNGHGINADKGSGAEQDTGFDYADQKVENPVKTGSKQFVSQSETQTGVNNNLVRNKNIPDKIDVSGNRMPNEAKIDKYKAGPTAEEKSEQFEFIMTDKQNIKAEKQPVDFRNIKNISPKEHKVVSGFSRDSFDFTENESKGAVQDNKIPVKEDYVSVISSGPVKENFKHGKEVRTSADKNVEMRVDDKNTEVTKKINPTDNNSETGNRSEFKKQSTAQKTEIHTTENISGKAARFDVTEKTNIVNDTDRHIPADKNFADNMAQTFLDMKDKNRAKLTVILHPKSLGKILIEITQTKHGIDARLLVENKETKEIIEAASDEMKSVVAKNGVDLKQVLVDINSHNTGHHESQEEFTRGQVYHKYRHERNIADKNYHNSADNDQSKNYSARDFGYNSMEIVI
ncbi:hypothetical protein DRQ07_03875 [candidate division KSB1 bacterium]|nr:MAG: hypothetical protein DRQ07_03875 [candidate division KSB1 bacterium]